MEKICRYYVIMLLCLVGSLANGASIELEIHGPSNVLPNQEYIFCIWLINTDGLFDDTNPQVIVTVVNGGTIIDADRGLFKNISTSDDIAIFWDSALKAKLARFGLFIVRTEASGTLSLEVEGEVADDYKFISHNGIIISDVPNIWDELAFLANDRAETTFHYRNLYADLVAYQLQSIPTTTVSRTLLRQGEQAVNAIGTIDYLLTGVADLSKMRLPWTAVADFSSDKIKGTAGIPTFYEVPFDLLYYYFELINRYTWYYERPYGYGVDVLADPYQQDYPGSLNNLGNAQNNEAAAWQTKQPNEVLNALSKQQTALYDAKLRASIYIGTAESFVDEGSKALFCAMHQYLILEEQTINHLQQIAKNMEKPVPQLVSQIPSDNSMTIGQNIKHTLSYKIKNSGGIASRGFFSLSVSAGLDVTNYSISKGSDFTPYYPPALIWHSDNQQYPAEFLLVETDPEWAADEEATITVTVIGSSPSTSEWIKYRLAFLPFMVEATDQSDYIRWPETISPQYPADQQNFASIKIDVTVEAQPAQPTLLPPVGIGNDWFVQPDSGDTLTDFDYYVQYYEPDGMIPVFREVYVDDINHTMSIFQDTDGIYHYNQSLPEGENHTFYFYFQTSDGRSARLPTTGAFDGPIVLPVHQVTQSDIPEGKAVTGPGEYITFTTAGSTCTHSHPVEYCFNWGDGTFSDWSTALSATHAWQSAGTYPVKAEARCSINHSIVSGLSGAININVNDTHIVDIPPEPIMPLWAVTEETEFFLGEYFCSQGHALEYQFYWGDGNYSDWLQDLPATHTWPEIGYYEVQVRTRCVTHHDIESKWSAGTFVLAADPNLKAAVEEALGISNPTLSDMHTLTFMSAGNRGIVSLMGIAEARNLVSLYLYHNNITNISALSGLTYLRDLDLSYNQIAHISTLANRTNLYFLNLNGNQITNISALSNLTNIQYLYLSNNQITDISALSNLTNVQQLSLLNNQITDVSALSDMTNLRELFLSHNQITDISALSRLANLQILSLHNNQISDVSPLSNLTSVQHLSLTNNQITDISAFSGLDNLSVLALDNNNINDISVLRGLTNLSRLILNSNDISEISSLSDKTHLEWLLLEGNPLNTSAYCTYIPLIIENNPEIDFLSYDPNPNPLSQDCSTNGGDLMTFTANWLETGCVRSNYWCNWTDLNHLGSVDFINFAVFATLWLEE